MSLPQTIRRLACLLGIPVVLLSVSVRAPAAVLDQSQITTNSNIFIGAVDQRIAQTFTPAITGDLDAVGVRIGYLPSPAGDASDLVLDVTSTTAGGLPTTTVLGTATLAHTAFPLAGGFNPAQFTQFSFTDLALHAGTRYALVLHVKTPGAVCGNRPQCSEPAYRANDVFGSDPYAGGQLFMASAALPTFALVGDLSFQTFMTATTIAVPEPQTWFGFLIGLTALLLVSRHRMLSRTSDYK